MVSLINEQRKAIANLFRLLSHRSVFDVAYVSADQIESRSRGHCVHKRATDAALNVEDLGYDYTEKKIDLRPHGVESPEIGQLSFAQRNSKLRRVFGHPSKPSVKK
jgi:hypothetical protein